MSPPRRRRHAGRRRYDLARPRQRARRDQVFADPRWRSFVGDRLYSARIGGSSVSSPPADRLAGT